MGRQQVETMVQCLSEDEALRWHLAHNLYPPVSDAFAISKAAIDALEAGDEDRILEDGALLARAYKIVEVFHLEPFVEARLEGVSEG